MAILTLNDWTNQDASRFSAGRVIRASDHDALWKRQSFIFQQSGAKAGGIVFDPFWSTNSTAYTQSGGGTYGMKNWQGVLCPQRPVGRSANHYAFMCQVYGKNVDVRFTFQRFDSGGPVTIGSTKIVTAFLSPDDYVFQVVTFTISRDLASIGESAANGPAVIGVHCHGRVGSGTVPGVVAWLNVFEDMALVTPEWPEADPALGGDAFSSGFSLGFS